MEERKSYQVAVRRGLHPDNFTCVPEGRMREVLSRWSENETTIIGSSGRGGMTLEKARRIASENTNREGYKTEAMGDVKLVSRGVIRENRYY